MRSKGGKELDTYATRFSITKAAGSSQQQVTLEEFLAGCGEDAWAEWVAGEVTAMGLPHSKTLAVITRINALFVPPIAALPTTTF